MSIPKDVFFLKTSANPIKKPMILGIDASNLRLGGGQTHLREFLQAAHPRAHGFRKVIVWGGANTLVILKRKKWLIRRSPPALQAGQWRRALWQRCTLPQAARKEKCSLLFSPGGVHGNGFHPVVTMSQNMLPFEFRELLRYGFSRMTLRLILLRWFQAKSFSHAEGVVFLTRYARQKIRKGIQSWTAQSAVIPHGISTRFFHKPKPQFSIHRYTTNKPYKILYVSIIDQYKHQWHVIGAVAELRKKTGWPLDLDLAGPAYPPAMRRMHKAMDQLDPERKWARYLGSVAYSKLPEIYHRADLGLFASSCENMPNILLEMMASGLPVVCSCRGPMAEILGDAGVYFEPEKPSHLVAALRRCIRQPTLRADLSRRSHTQAKQYTWKRSAEKTFAFLSRVARENAIEPHGVGRHSGCRRVARVLQNFPLIKLP